MKPVVLVHGAWHGPWCWERVTPLLDAAGVPWLAPDLPSCARAQEGAGLIDDVKAVEAALDALPGDEPAILLGHSYGGRVISEAGAHPRVGSLVYLTAFLTEPGEDTAALGVPSMRAMLDFPAPSTSIPKAGPGRDIFYNDCTDEQATWATERLRPMFWGGDPVTPPRLAWTQKPAIYVICSLDNAIPAPAQHRMAARARRSLKWETGHSPFLSRPELVAGLLIALAK